MLTSNLFDEVKPCTEDNIYAHEEKIKVNQNDLRKLCVTPGDRCAIVEEHGTLRQNRLFYLLLQLRFIFFGGDGIELNHSPAEGN